MKRLPFILKYLKYWLRSKNQHSIHSPFIFRFYNELIKGTYRPLADIENLRTKLKNDPSEIEVNDLGAGSVGDTGKTRKISSIVKSSAKAPKYSSLLHRIAHHYQPKEILELGTSLGISTLYLSKACPDSTITTMEGSPSIAEKARQHFKELGRGNISIMEGDFDDSLPLYLQEKSPDLIFFDGNHRKDPTLNYFSMCLEKAHANSVFIFDDIHWSKGMEQAWDEIKSHPKVRVSIDLFFLGIILFRGDQAKEDFVLRY